MRGKVLLHGKKLDSYKSADLFRNNLCMLPQDPKSLFVMKTVRKELEEMLSPGEEESLPEIASLCGLGHLLDRPPYDLSGGEQQRTALAKVLLTEPKVLLLDEPTKGMDNFFKIHFGGILKELQRRGVTILLVSHDVEFCARYADLTAMCFHGEIVSVNTTRRFFGGNSFYTTAANRMSRHLMQNAVTEDDVIETMTT